ncbi:MAG: hypothetical protein WC401_11535 [Bacteroidales bacterium]
MNQDEEFKQQIQANDAGEARAELLGIIETLRAENSSLRHILALWRKTEAQKEIDRLKEEVERLKLALKECGGL